MKQILMVIMMLASTTALAGTSEQDPAVASIRARFERAHTPSDAELRLGKVWNCRWLAAKKNDVRTSSYSLVIRKFDGLYTRGDYTMIRTPKGLRTNTNSTDYSIDFDTTRIDPNGHLLREDSFTDDIGVPYWKVFDNSIANYDAYVYSYTVCIPKNKPSSPSPSKVTPY